jgi:hypothetical protein
MASYNYSKPPKYDSHSHSRMFNQLEDDEKDIVSEKIRLLINVVKELGLQAGEGLIMLNKTFKMLWDTIPKDRFDEINTWFRNNAFRKYQIIAPELHAGLMEKDAEYKKGFDFRDRQVNHWQDEPKTDYRQN